MSTTDPMQRFREERKAAFDADDPTAGLCTAASIDADGEPQTRTLVLRSVGDDLALFINASSPKWQQLKRPFAVHTYWPSTQIQYRLRVSATELDKTQVDQSWLLRPEPPKKMDYFYERIGHQTSAIESRDVLLDKLHTLDLPTELTAPAGARGLLLEILTVERLDLNMENGIHDRRRWMRTGTVWSETVLVP